jgi:polysaccharide biosynthesis transport protein
VPIDLKNLLRIARRWWWLLILAPVLGGTTAFYVSDRQPDMYAADVTLLVSAGVSSSSNAGSVQASQNLTDTYSMWAVSRPVLENSAKSLNYEGGSETLAKNVTSAPVKDTLFIVLTATDTDPQRAAAIADTVATEFVANVQLQTGEQNAQVRGQIDDQIAQTTEQINQTNSSIRDLETRQPILTTAENAELQSLRDDRAKLQEELDRLQATVRSIDVELASAQTRIVVSSPAVAPTEPYAPNKTQATVIGVFVGLTLAIAASILFEYLDNTVRNREELSRIANAPVLAAIASAPSLKRGGSSLFVLDQPNSASAEAMRLLRANLEFASAPDRLTSLAITSPGPDEGKSTLTANLGVVMANAGLKTVIIDADLRRPTQHKIFGVSNGRGLSTLLATPNPDWRQEAMALSIHNLVLIPSGPLPPNPADLLSLDRFSHILAGLSEWADVVLIDCTPMLSASDALVVATRARGALLVSRANQTRNDAVRRSTAALAHAHVRLLGVVLNRTQSDDIDHYGRYEEAPNARPATAQYYFGSENKEMSLGRTIAKSNGKKQPTEHVEADAPLIHEM